MATFSIMLRIFLTTSYPGSLPIPPVSRWQSLCQRLNGEAARTLGTRLYSSAGWEKYVKIKKKYIKKMNQELDSFLGPVIGCEILILSCPSFCLLNSLESQSTSLIHIHTQTSLNYITILCFQQVPTNSNKEEFSHEILKQNCISWFHSRIHHKKYSIIQHGPKIWSLSSSGENIS